MLDDDRKSSSRSTPSTTTPATAACARRWPISTTCSSREPNIQVYSVDQRGDRSLTLRHTQHNRRPLNPDTAAEVLKHLRRLWGFKVRLETADESENVELVAEV